MKKRMFVMLLSVLVVVAGIAWYKYSAIKKMQAGMAMMMSAPSVVSTAKITSTQWQTHEEAVGSIRAVKGVDLASEVSGIVEEIHFTSDQDVKEGDLLVKLRADDEIAKLHTLEAAQNLADTNLARDRKQFAVKAISQATIDIDNATVIGARAQVAEQKAVVEKRFIRAPFSGRIGIRNIDLGQYINPGVSIATLQALDSVYCDFSLSQQDMLNIKVGQKVALLTDAHPERTFEGEISAINPKVDTATRNVQMRATLNNADHALLPGMYATVEITVGDASSHITLPQTAITYNPYGNTVYIVDEEKKEGEEPKLIARQSFVTLGAARGDQVAVMSGVKDGDTVVISGQIKLHNGAVLKVDNSVVPTSDKNPVPEDK